MEVRIIEITDARDEILKMIAERTEAFSKDFYHDLPAQLIAFHAAYRYWERGMDLEAEQFSAIALGFGDPGFLVNSDVNHPLPLFQGSWAFYLSQRAFASLANPTLSRSQIIHDAQFLAQSFPGSVNPFRESLLKLIDMLTATEARAQMRHTRGQPTAPADVIASLVLALPDYGCRASATPEALDIRATEPGMAPTVAALLEHGEDAVPYLIEALIDTSSTRCVIISPTRFDPSAPRVLSVGELSAYILTRIVGQDIGPVLGEFQETRDVERVRRWWSER